MSATYTDTVIRVPVGQSELTALILEIGHK